MGKINAAFYLIAFVGAGQSLPTRLVPAAGRQATSELRDCLHASQPLEEDMTMRRYPAPHLGQVVSQRCLRLFQ